MDIAKLKDQPRESVVEVFRELYLKDNRTKNPHWTDQKILNQPVSVDSLLQSLVDTMIQISKQQSEINELRTRIISTESATKYSR